jgi:GNAT superfamily N-acetyltransferase
MISVQEEQYPDIIETLKPLFPLHWEELGLNRDKVPLDPNYGEYLRRHHAGMVLMVTAREDGQLCGYSVNFIAPGLHYQRTLTLTTDIYWVKPDARGANIGVALFTEVLRLAKARGVRLIHAGVKEHFSAAWLFEKLGFEKIESYYHLWIGD